MSVASSLYAHRSQERSDIARRMKLDKPSFPLSHRNLPPRPWQTMTWSIIARDPTNGAYGIAIASKFFAVGALCPHGEGGVGAASTEALPNALGGYRGIVLF